MPTRSEAEWRERAVTIWNAALEGRGLPMEPISLMLRFGREMADERAEEIVKSIEHTHFLVQRASTTTKPEHRDYERGLMHGLERGAHEARRNLSEPEPKTREQVLEEALRAIAGLADKRGMEASAVGPNAIDIARWALLLQ
jgi:hypothetical protein